ncbi:CLUMA_CG007182, isoform A [Clunio marinus]|uniref:Aldose 1-epimerase n=1 Tax=Clunio marinus TaxID=568069 RepID=A0A1J1I063_9DIPT|nr:CLUMA_CG007182, isoform A [Clunio marinus]
MTSHNIELSIDTFGSVENPITKKQEEVKKFTWRNVENGMSVVLISYGVIIQSIKVPDRSGNLADVVCGFDDVSGYLQSNNPYFGAMVGRVANRIAHGEFVLNGEVRKVAKNWNNKHHLHGGIIGFNKFNFNHYVVGNVVYLSHLSPDNFEGYPGDLLLTIKCELTSDNSIAMEYKATSSKSTPINLTNHSYFNLAGHETGFEELYKHVISINADKITETDSESIPTGKFTNVGGTPFDLRISKELGPAMRNLNAIGYDDNFCINIPKGFQNSLNFVSRAVHPPSGRWLEVSSNQEGVQLYTSNFFPDPCGNINASRFVSENYYEVDGVLTTKLDKVTVSTKDDNSAKCSDESALVGKGGVHYLKHGAFCLETQKFPDAVNHSNFPSVILNPGETYQHEVVFKFGCEA